MTHTRKLIDENGKRTDGRGIDDLRTVKITVGPLKNADGSAFIEFGKNRILAPVYGPAKCTQSTWHFPTGVCFVAVITCLLSPQTRARILLHPEGKSRSLR